MLADKDTGLVALLAGDFPSAGILSVSWDSSAFVSSGRGLDLNASGSKVLSGLLNAKVGEFPTVFIGHSMGGLMMKTVVVELHSQSKHPSPAHSLLRNLRSAVFIANPHDGSNLAGWLQCFGVRASAFGFAPSRLIAKCWQTTLQN